MQCTCGWKKPLICVVSLEKDTVEQLFVEQLFVAVACPECGTPYNAHEQEHEDVPDERIASMVDFVQETLRAKLADA